MKSPPQTDPASLRTRAVRVVILVLAGGVAGFGATRMVADRGAADVTGVLAGQPAEPPPKSIQAPSPVLTPEGVVELQYQALADYRENRSAIHQVFLLASPPNRAVTGPVERFEQMILSPPYRDMVFAQGWTVGQAVVRGRYAMVLVSSVDRRGRISLYRFYLSQQTGDLDGCWMTDRVLCEVAAWDPAANPDGMPPAGDTRKT